MTSVFFWTCPMFTAIFGSLYLKEVLTHYDWAAVVLAFVGIVMIQNPFSSTEEANLNDIIGTSIALTGAILAAIMYISVRVLFKDSKVHFLIPPTSFVVFNLIFSPLILFSKLILFGDEKTLN